jgi:hypothetical protein
MNKLAFLLFVFLYFIAYGIEAQNRTDSIAIVRGFRMKFVQHDTIRTKVETLEIMKVIPEAYKNMRSSIINSNVGIMCRFFGGVLIFIPLANKIEGRIPNWTSAKIGIGLVIASIPYAGFAASYAEKSVNIYNLSTIQLGKYNLKYQFGITNDGVGLKIRL